MFDLVMMKKNQLAVVDVVNVVEIVGKKGVFFNICDKLFYLLARTLIDTSNSASPTAGRLPHGARPVRRIFVFN
jgi:hypothetical protein